MTEANAAPAPFVLRDIARAIRTRQWAKNVLLFAGFVFAGKLRSNEAEFWPDVVRVLMAFVCFCALSGIAYLINDWQDLERDRLHPVKKNRPLASGRLSLRAAAVLGAFLAVTALVLVWAIYLSRSSTWAFGLSALAYFASTLAYSFRLKHEPVIDVLCLAVGFVIRVVAGCQAIPVNISPWIVFCTFNLALFVSLCKRRAELVEVGGEAGTRKVLQLYTPAMLDTFIAVAAGLTIISYSLYTFNSETLAASLGNQLAQTPLMMTSIPFVVYGVFRYLLLAHSSPVGGEPEQMLRDKPLLLNGLLWVLWVAILTLLPALLDKPMLVSAPTLPPTTLSTPPTASAPPSSR